MYRNILKKDLQNKKTMNAILLIFIILAAMFMSSSINNIVSISNGIENYFDKAEVGNYLLLSRRDDEKKFEDGFSKMSDVRKMRIERQVKFGNSNLIKNGHRLDLDNEGYIISVDGARINYFDDDNEKIKSVKPGEIYASYPFIDNYHLKAGQEVEIRFGKSVRKLKIKGGFKDAIFGSYMAGNPKILVNQKDYSFFKNTGNAQEISVFYLDVSDSNSFENKLSDLPQPIFSCDRQMLKMTHFIDMLVSGILFLMSICLILISLVVLKFTISFTLSEELREIGVMKAVGIGNLRIKGLYLTKYFAIAAAGSFIGFFTGIPVGDYLLKSVSRSIVLSSQGSLLINVLSSVLVMAVVMLFCFGCTAKIRKVTPMEAIREGQSGERYRQKGCLELSRSPLKTNFAIALNDVLSNPLRYLTIGLVFVISLAMVLSLSTMTSTITSEKMLPTVGIDISDAYIDTAKLKEEAGTGYVKQGVREIEEKLNDAGMPARVDLKISYNYLIEHGRRMQMVQCQKAIAKNNSDDCQYVKGDAPKSAYEVAITDVVAKKLNAKIGDRIIINRPEGRRRFLVTGIFESMNNLGGTIRLYDGLDTEKSIVSGALAYQINFDDHPTQAVIQKRVGKMKKIFKTKKVTTASGYSTKVTGASDIVNGLKNAMLLVALISIGLVSLLVERSFIIKETSELALLKAIGFRNRTLTGIHTLRFVIVGLISSVVAILVSPVFTNVFGSAVFSNLGLKHVSYVSDPLRNWLIYPAVVMLTMFSCIFATAQIIRRIKASQVSNID